MKIVKPVFYIATSLVLVSCGTASKINSSVAYQHVEGTTIPVPQEDLSEEALKMWPHQSLLEQGVPGLSLDQAYKLLEKKKSNKVIVGVIDSGVDINHEDLKDVIWTNPKEIPNNGIDDDNNGYIDDIHGWNFLGNINEENLEFVRILKKGETDNPDYQRALEMYEKEFGEAQESAVFYKNFVENIINIDSFLKKETSKEIYTQEDLAKLDTSDPKINQAVTVMNNILSRISSVEQAIKELTDAEKHFDNKLKYHLNKDFDVRSTILKDNPDDINDRIYGDNNVIGPVLDGALHGTHVAGIIGAVRNNGIGMNGVADNIEIMVVRAVPDGDEYDKDIALAIRYAADNGAKVINTSFGKGFSPHKQWVYDAIKYAASKDVLIVNAAGNDAKDIDTELTYPDDNVDGIEYTDNVLTIGALNYKYGENLLANFTNYGKKNVDIFSPGVQIYATIPGNKYRFLQGTSMAAPEAAGLAALIRSYFPKLKAAQVKEIIMKSGITPDVKQVIIGGEENNKRPFAELSKSGKIINAYNAILMASKLSK
ncbi:S8 family peptidase [Capnocytophaga catalasegens]|uniref:Peptidase S8 n=1 Tax=Capnocytophaga catalasegens TaxID=1004260 RepID=A0AAV5AXV1_9FLAO|nr:S8 family peptidase [Capnocytophaga catalasegens]GIZ16501.1 peptidase S8 [Capnocytophaga catalasegens]GJM51429.1 peptidase S8 [Capnocytophaga catalasegens]GJM53167.1 peptidase S8 [Capnocytophaga catalasegens]